jgi:hypothetical protein
MPWAPKAGALKFWRERRRLTKVTLAAESGISDRQIRAFESKKPPATMYESTLDAFAGVLSVRRHDLAVWVDHGFVPAESEVHEPKIEPVAPTSAPSLPPLGRLSRYAKKERELGLSRQRAKTPSGEVDLLGLDWFKRCFSRPKAFDSQRFVVHGVVDEFMGIPDAAAKVIGAEPGMGAKFRVSREVAEGLPFYATVFAPTSLLADQIMEHLDDRERPTTLIARVLFAPPKADWKGFYIFEEAPRPREFAYVVEQIVPANTTVRNVDRILENRAGGARKR